MVAHGSYGSSGVHGMAHVFALDIQTWPRGNVLGHLPNPGMLDRWMYVTFSSIEIQTHGGPCVYVH